MSLLSDGKKVNVNVVIDEELLSELQKHCRGNRNGYRSEVKRAQPVDGVEVTVPDEHAMESDVHTMSDAELLEYVVWQLANNRQI